MLHICLTGSMSEVSLFTHTLTQIALYELQTMRHSNGSPLVCLYHHQHPLHDIRQQGPIVNFNLLKDDGSFIGFSEVVYFTQIYFLVFLSVPIESLVSHVAMFAFNARRWIVQLSYITYTCGRAASVTQAPARCCSA